ncbi:hypothetical protein SAMN06295970_10815 [Noviherbaspirillum suwonense]|uniref:DUF3558 domain-containing protein n=2 Tax=Noviherbaspirillum suwonense TaxID=1224511 RepID=A0ABY1Q8A0_9BURK|nr:hypothetical protein SAMN06295970_10815 [Noviherbaspirillum suwonense]
MRACRPGPSAQRRVLRVAGMLAIVIAGSAPDAIAQKARPEDTLKSATDTANKIREATGGKPAAKPVPSGNPCAILSSSDVQKAFPGAKAGERSTRLEQYGITECSWKGPAGQVVLAVQESMSEGTVKDDVMGMAMGFTDPLKANSTSNVRFESFSGLGYPAMGFVEKADPARSILGDGALLIMRDGQRTISLGSAELPQRDRAAALKVLDDLGKSAAKRFKQ